MIIKLDSEVIAEIRNALQVIQGNAELIIMRGIIDNRPDIIIHQVKRIDKLLPQVKFEGGMNERTINR